jgi:hypothetical protein
MAKTTPPADADQAPAEELPATLEAPPGPRFWRYSGPERTYADIPVTVQVGDVIEYTRTAEVEMVVDGDIVGNHTFAVPPAYDGCWEPCDGPATVHPDNHSTTDSAGA